MIRMILPVKIRSCLLIVLTTIAFISCTTERKGSQNENTMDENQNFIAGTFGYDLTLVKENRDIILLKNRSENAQVMVCTAFQGRVMTSTLEGLNGFSLGWINHDLIRSGEEQEHINAYGGADRFWVGPEGGQFSLFFKPGTEFSFENWFTPEEIDTEPFDLVSFNDTVARFKKEMKLLNYSGTLLEFMVSRNVKLLNHNDIEKLLEISVDNEVPFVGFETENIITNTGDFEWTKETGMLSVWILGMLNPSPGTTIVIPFRTGDETELGRIVNDEYFGKVPADRLVVGEGVMYFKGDGKYRSKIGLTPMRARPVAGSYSEEHRILTIIQFSLPEGRSDYVNSMWEFQDDPFSGDAVNSYNDGPLEDGGQMGPFYELESSSPAANLSPGERIVHYHRTIHFKGEEKNLDPISKEVLGVGINQIKAAF